MSLFEDAIDKTLESGKEITLYTPYGAGMMNSVHVLPPELFHLTLICTVPCLVLLVKGHRAHRKAHRGYIISAEMVVYDRERQPKRR